MTEPVRPWRGVSAEDRRAERRGQLVEACLDVIAESGVDGVTVDAIVRGAGLSKRYFYESFIDRDDILAATVDLLMERVRARLVDAVADHDAVAERMRQMVIALATTLAEDPRATRLYVEAGRSLAAEQRREHAIDEFSQLLVEHLFDGSKDPRVAATVLLIVAGTTQVLARWLGGDLKLSQAEIVDLIVGFGMRARDALV